MSWVFLRGPFLCSKSLWNRQRKMAGALASATVRDELAAELILFSLMTGSYLIAREMAPSACRAVATQCHYAGQRICLIQAAPNTEGDSACLDLAEEQMKLACPVIPWCAVCQKRAPPLNGFVLRSVNPVLPSRCGGKGFKRSEHVETNPCAVSVVIRFSCGFLVPWGTPGGYV